MTPEYLRSLLWYEPETGHFWWRVRRRGVQCGTRAGYQAPDGRWYVTVDGIRHLAHRLAWFHVHGHWPSVSVDHINGDHSDNRLTNLREATLSQNQENQRSGARKGTSRHLGVHWNERRQRWCAQIKTGGRNIHVGYFAVEDAAAAAYQQAKAELHTFGPTSS